MPDDPKPPDPKPTDPPAPDDKPLGPEGEKALAAFKERARAAEAAQRELQQKFEAQQTQLDKIKQQQMTDAEKALEDARAEARKAAEADLSPQLRGLALENVVLKAANGRLHDPEDAVLRLREDMELFDDKGTVDADKVSKAIDKLIEDKPHLAATATSPAPPTPNRGAGTPPGGKGSDERAAGAAYVAQRYGWGKKEQTTPA